MLVAWGPPGAKSWSISGLRGVPGRPPEGRRDRPGATSAIVRQLFGNCSAIVRQLCVPLGGVRAAIWEHFCSRALRHDKSDKIHIIFKISRMFGCFCFDSFVFLAAPARERTLLKQGFRLESVTFFACPAFARATKRTRNLEENRSNNYLTTCRKHTQKDKRKHQNVVENCPRSSPEPS